MGTLYLIHTVCPPPERPRQYLIHTVCPPPEHPRQYLIDGVYLLATGMQQIQSQIIPLPKIKRQQRPRRQPKTPFGARTPRMYGVDGDDSFDKGGWVGGW